MKTKGYSKRLVFGIGQASCLAFSIVGLLGLTFLVEVGQVFGRSVVARQVDLFACVEMEP